MTSTDRPTALDNTAPASPDAPAAVHRRRLLRGGAIAVGATVIGAAVAPSASAADNGNAILGVTNTATKTTGITLNGPTGNPTVPALTLTNANGPSLALNALPEDWDGALGVGQMAGTTLGPLVGIDGGDGPVTTYLATGIELDSLPLPVPVTPPIRVLDTRSAAGRVSIVRTSGSALDSSNRLKAKSWIDVAVDSAAGAKTVEAAFLNVTATAPTSAGYLSLYPPGARPASSSVNFTTGATVANAAFVGVGFYGSAFVVRIYASATTHVILDVTGETVTLVPGPAVQARARASQSHRTRPSMQRGARSLSRGSR